MKYMYICDICGKMEPHKIDDDVKCPDCGAKLRQTNMPLAFWERQSATSKEKIIEEYNVDFGKTLLDYGTYINTQNLGNAWLVIMKIMVWVLLLVSVLVSVGFGVYLLFANEIPNHTVYGILIIAGGSLSSLISASALMAILCMFEDVNEIKHYLAQKFNIKFYKE